MRYRVGDRLIDIAARAIRDVDGGVVRVEPQVFDVITYLIDHRDRAVPKSELLDEVWGSRFVSESALTSRIKSARAVIGDSGRDQWCIRTVQGFGYQFVAPLDTPAGPAGADGERLSPPSTVRGMRTFHSAFHGRDAELREITAIVGGHRLLTLLGPGGIGKTRLAVELIERADDSTAPFDLPVLFVDLATTRDERAVPDAVALALGIEVGQRDDPTDAVGEFLAAIPHLVLLDNCEHVLPAIAAMASNLLDRTTGATFVATSRVPLGIPGERLYRLGPLPVPPEDTGDLDALAASPAAAIFLDRASLTGADPFERPEDAGLVAQLCRSLDGVPLALELAAGRVAAFGLADLIGLLDRRLDVLGDRSSTRDERHRTLRATVEWSYGLLDEPSRRLLRHLAVFPGGVTIDRLEWIGDALGLGVSGLDTAAHLVEASLLTRDRAPSGTRYLQLETLRTFGLDQLRAEGEEHRAGELQASAVLELVRRADAGLRSADEIHWVRLVREEIPNVRVARAFLADNDRIDDLIELLRHLMLWSRMRDANEVWLWADDLVDRVPPGDRRRPAVCAIHAQAAWRRGDIEGALADGAVALESGEAWVVTLALAEIAAARMFVGDVDGAEADWARQAELERPPDFALPSAALAASYAGRIEDARRHLAMAEARGGMSVSAQAWRDYATAEVANTVGDADILLLERAIEAGRAADASFIVGVATVTLTSIHAAQGDVGRAAARYEELIRHWLRSGSWTQQWTTLRQAASLLEPSHPEVALAILRAADADPTSPALVGEAATEGAALRARLEDVVGDRLASSVYRLDIAEAARRALADMSG